MAQIPLFLSGAKDTDNLLNNLDQNVLNQICKLVQDDEFVTKLHNGLVPDASQNMVIPLSRLVKFPPPQDLNINMMPIMLNDLINTLPKKLHGYIDVIRMCPAAYNGCVAYLTVHESLVKGGESQRRPGVHIEAPIKLVHGGHCQGEHDGIQDHVLGTRLH